MSSVILPFSPRSGSPANVDALGRAHPPAGPDARIVSLVPSLTELVCDLGLGGRLVGRTGFCIHPREALRTVPKVGGTKDVKVEVLKALAPTHLIVNIDENRKDAVEELAAFVPHVIVTHPCTPADNLQLYRLFGGVFGCEAEARRLEAALQSALDDAAALRAGLADEAVLYLIWRQPWMTVARDTYISAMLETVGWRTLPDGVQQRYPVFEWALAERAARVFLSSEPYHFNDSHVPEVEALGRRPATLIDGEMVSWYGSRAIAGLRYLIALRRRLAGLADG
jgi:ABC-type Fe3+-hydroxamate transport system substrate-binding protein